MKEKNRLDYGWRLQGEKKLISQDRSIVYDDSLQDIMGLLKESSKNYYSMERCMQCGICTNSCPQNLLSNEFSPRQLIQKLRLGLIDESMEEMWLCTNCKACELSCPFEISFLQVQRELRSLIMENGFGYIPKALKNAVSSIQYYYNPWNFDQRDRLKMTTPSTVSEQNESYILFLGCFASFDSHGKKIARAAMSILDKLGLSYEVLGEDEVCCGDCAYRTGANQVFEQMKELNIKAFEEKKSRNILTICPHSYDIFTKNYFAETNDFQVKPLIVFLCELLEKGEIKPEKQLDISVTLHDPCFFARHNGIISELRELINSIPGIQLVEMEHNGVKSICCGGGGGGVFMDRKKGKRLSEIRINEAIRTKTDTMITACPICAAMFDDAVNSMETNNMHIIDIVELIALAI